MFDKKLRELRKLHSYSQIELAKIIGVSQQSVAKWENSKSFPDVDSLIKISDIFGVSFDELLGRTSPNPETEIPVYKTMYLETETYENGEYSYIPHFNINDIIQFTPLLYGKKGDSNKYFAVEITDQSMSPSFIIRDIVIFKIGDTYEGVSDYLFFFKGKVYFRKLTQISIGYIATAAEQSVSPMLIITDAIVLADLYPGHNFNDSEFFDMGFSLYGKAVSIDRWIN